MAPVEGALQPKTFGVVGTGVIGSGWAVRALSRGIDRGGLGPGARRRGPAAACDRPGLALGAEARPLPGRRT